MDLTWCIFLPLVTAGVLLVIPASRKGLLKSIAVLGAIITFLLSTDIVRKYPFQDGATCDAVQKLEAELESVIIGSNGVPGFTDSEAFNDFRNRYLPKPAELTRGSSFELTDDQREELEDRVLVAAPDADLATVWDRWEHAVELSYALAVPQTRHMHFVEYVPWIPSFKVNYFLGVDGLSLPLIWLTALLGVLCLVYSWTIDKGTKGFYILFLILETGLIGVFAALDFFLFYVFWEIVLLPMYFLIGVWGGPNRIYAAIKFFIYTLVGSVLMLIVMLIMYFTSEPHTFNVLALMHTVPGFDLGLQWWLFIGLFIGFAIKVPVFPFHTWLPDAHVEAPTSVSVVLAGILLKMGGYGFFRFSYPMTPTAATDKTFIALVAVLAMINIIYGAFCAMAQKDFKKLVAYSSISHMGYVLLGMAALTYVGVNGAVLQMFNHGVSSAMMFLLVGVIYDRAHHRNLTRFGGIGLQMPWYTGLATVGLFASLGLPGLNGFVSEVMCFLGAWNTDPATGSLITTGISAEPGSLIGAAVGAERVAEYGGIASKWIVLTSLLGVVLAACYILWTIQRVYLGTIRDESYKRFPDVSFREVFALAPLAFLCVVLGVFPWILIDFMHGSLATITDMVRAVLTGG